MSAELLFPLVGLDFLFSCRLSFAGYEAFHSSRFALSILVFLSCMLFRHTVAGVLPAVRLSGREPRFRCSELRFVFSEPHESKSPFIRREC